MCPCPHNDHDRGGGRVSGTLSEFVATNVGEGRRLREHKANTSAISSAATRNAPSAKPSIRLKKAELNHAFAAPEESYKPPDRRRGDLPEPGPRAHGDPGPGGGLGPPRRDINRYTRESVGGEAQADTYVNGSLFAAFEQIRHTPVLRRDPPVPGRVRGGRVLLPLRAPFRATGNALANGDIGIRHHPARADASKSNASWTTSDN